MSIKNYDNNDHRDQERGYANPTILRDAASKMVVIARRTFRNRPLVFVGQGGSGVSLATACLLACRKRSYMVATHRDFLACEIERVCEGLDNPAVVFVDDYICHGATLRKVTKACKKEKKGVKIHLAIAIAKDRWLFKEENTKIEGVPVKTLR